MEDDRLAEIATTEGTLDDLLLRADSKERLWSLWVKLSTEDRMLLEGKHILDLTDEELAGILDCMGGI